jgi:hypothetical protein
MLSPDAVERTAWRVDPGNIATESALICQWRLPVAAGKCVVCCDERIPPSHPPAVEPYRVPVFHREQLKLFKVKAGSSAQSNPFVKQKRSSVFSAPLLSRHKGPKSVARSVVRRHAVPNAKGE